MVKIINKLINNGNNHLWQPYRELMNERMFWKDGKAEVIDIKFEHEDRQSREDWKLISNI